MKKLEITIIMVLLFISSALSILFAGLHAKVCNENLELKYDILAYIVKNELGNEDFEIIYYKDENKAKVIYTYEGKLDYVWYELQDDKWIVIYE